MGYPEGSKVITTDSECVRTTKLNTTFADPTTFTIITCRHMASLNKQTSYDGQNSALSFLVTGAICVSATIQSSYDYEDGIHSN